MPHKTVVITPRWERGCDSYDAHVAGVNVGYINVERDGESYRICGMYITPTFRGKKIARSLMQAVVDRYKTHELTLRVGPFHAQHESSAEPILTKQQLLRFYRTFGFTSRAEDPTQMRRKADRPGRRSQARRE